MTNSAVEDSLKKNNIQIIRTDVGDKKVYEIAALNEQIKSLRSEFVDTRTLLMTLKMESTVKNKLFEKGIKTSKKPPVKIVINVGN